MATTTRSSKLVILTNMLVTFVEAGIGYVVANMFTLPIEVKILAGGAVSTGLSAVYNVYVKPYLRLHGWMR